MKVSFLVLLILSPIVLLAQLDREAIERQRIVANHIAQATQYTHKYTKDKPAPQGYVTCVTKYGRNGNPTSIINYRANGEVSSRLMSIIP